MPPNYLTKTLYNKLLIFIIRLAIYIFTGIIYISTVKYFEYI